MWCRFDRKQCLCSNFSSSHSYFGVTLVLSESSVWGCICGRFNFLTLQLFSAFWRIRMFGAGWCLSHDRLKSLYIHHSPRAWKRRRPPKLKLKLNMCSLFLDSQCFTSVYFSTCSVSSFMSLRTQQDVSPKLIRRQKQRITKGHRHQWACGSPSARSHANALICTCIFVNSLRRVTHKRPIKMIKWDAVFYMLGT